MSSSEPSAVGTTVVRPPGVPDEHPIPDVSLLRLFEDAVRDAPDGEAVVAGRVHRTNAELAGDVRAARTTLVAAGIGAGTLVRVEVVDPVQRIAAMWAAWSVGAAIVLGPGTSPVPTVHIRSTGRGPRASGVLGEFSDRVARSVRRRPGASAELEVGRPVGPASAPASAPVAPLPSDVAIVLALGTSGGPGAGAAADGSSLLTHRALVAAAFQARLWVPDVRTGAERCLVDALPGTPAQLALGLLATTLAAGTLVVADGSDLARSAERERTTLAALTPEGLRTLARSRRAGLTALRAVLVDAGDGAPDAGVPWEDAAALARASGGARVAGMTSAVGALPTHAHPVYGHVDPRAIGLPLTSTRSRVVDAGGAVVPAGTAGTLVVDGPQLSGSSSAPWVAVADARGAVHRVAPRVMGDRGDAGGAA